MGVSNRYGSKKKKKQNKKKSSEKGKRSSVRQKQSFQRNTLVRGNTISFINKPLSNFDLIARVKKLGIKHFRGIKSKDNLPKQIKKNECGIINLDTHIGPGTHWIAYRNGDKYAEYFDSFGLKMPFEISDYPSTSGKQIIYSGDEIQERDSVLCGYWCLYYLLERQMGTPTCILRVIHNAKFNMNEQSVNYRFIIEYFETK